MCMDVITCVWMSPDMYGRHHMCVNVRHHISMDVIRCVWMSLNMCVCQNICMDAIKCVCYIAIRA